MKCLNRCTLTTLAFFTLTMMYIMKLDPNSQNLVFDTITREHLFLGIMILILGYLVINSRSCDVKK